MAVKMININISGDGPRTRRLRLDVASPPLLLLLLQLPLLADCLRGCHGLSNFDSAEFRRLLQSQDGFFLEDEIRPAEREIRLEDFFWTGESGDGPPYHMRRPNVVGDGGFNFVRTSTMYATVYLHDDHHAADSVCRKDCDYTVIDDRLDVEDVETIGSKQPVLQMPEDRRFWLLTVLEGHYDAKRFEAIQDRLASLYRLAFSRQHLWHLGVDGTMENPLDHVDTSTQMPTIRSADSDEDTAETAATEPINLRTTPTVYYSTTTMSPSNTSGSQSSRQPASVPTNCSTSFSSAPNNEPPSANTYESTTPHVTANTSDIDAEPVVHAANAAIEISINRQARSAVEAGVIVAETTSSSSSMQTQQRRRRRNHYGATFARQRLPPQKSAAMRTNAAIGTKISVLVYNVTLLSGGVATDSCCPNQTTMAKMTTTTTVATTTTTSMATTETTTNGAAWSANQTEIVYAVFVDGKPVLASTAAADMQLVSKAEVAHVMDQMVYTKAEPYLKEPLATSSISTDAPSSPSSPPPIPPPLPEQSAPASPATPPVESAASPANITTLLADGNQHANVFVALLQQHPIWIGILGAALLLLLFGLILGLVLMTRSKRLRSAQVKRLTARRTLIDDATQAGGPGVRLAAVSGGGAGGYPHGGIGYGEMVETTSAYANAADGVDNFGYDRDDGDRRADSRQQQQHQQHQQQQQQQQHLLQQRGDTTTKRTVNPVIHFPKPPAGSPSSSSSTSDSSIYYPHGRTRLDIQSILDEKAVNMFRKKSLTSDADETGGAPYATVEKRRVSTTTAAAAAAAKKPRKKYMRTPNRVGSFDKDTDVDNDDAFGSGEDGDAMASSRPGHHYEKVEAVNSVDFANRNPKPIQTRREDDGLATAASTEAINPDVLYCIDHRGGRQQRTSSGSGDSAGSLASYLSQASAASSSLRKFPPRYAMPVPMQQVLEPLSVTHLDQQSEGGAESSRSVDRRRAARRRSPVASGFVVYKEEGGLFNRTWSDGADPGVLGPVVWEMHKKHAEGRGVLSPIRDPLKARNRFEGLLEEAINLYGDDNLNTSTPRVIATPSTTGLLTNGRTKDTRLKTAAPSRKPISTEFVHRPLTAGPVNTISCRANEPRSQAHSPLRGAAWGSATPSPLVRPLSAGPFHRPDVDVVRVLAPTNGSMIAGGVLSTAPLIEAIQKELRKFDRPH